MVVDLAAFSVTSDAGDSVKVDCSGGFVRVFDDGAPTVYSTNCVTVTSLSIAGGPLDNVIDLSAVGAATFVMSPSVTIHGEGGIDTITGGDLADALFGDAGVDLVDGRGGSDTFTWDPGDGNDSFNGGAGADTLVFNGSNGAETITIVADGTGFNLSRNVGSVTLNIDGTEALSLQALAGDDTISTVPLVSISQVIDGGAHVVGDTLAIAFGSSCATHFGSINAVAIELQTLPAGTCTAADIDGNGSVEPLTDGLLLLRYAFGFRGPTLVAGAVAGDCGRCDAAEIEAYLQNLY